MYVFLVYSHKVTAFLSYKNTYNFQNRNQNYCTSTYCYKYRVQKYS